MKSFKLRKLKNLILKMQQKYEELAKKLINSRINSAQSSKSESRSLPQTSRSLSNRSTTNSFAYSHSQYNQHEIVQKILIRWWYGLPDWPPENYDYRPALRASNLYLLKDVIEVSPYLSKKQVVVELEGYPGIFQDRSGNLYDLRPQHLCPSYNNLIQKSTKELIFILIRCLENQLSSLLGTSDYLISSVQSLEREIEDTYARLT